MLTVTTVGRFHNCYLMNPVKYSLKVYLEDGELA